MRNLYSFNEEYFDSTFTVYEFEFEFEFEYIKVWKTASLLPYSVVLLVKFITLTLEKLFPLLHHIFSACT